MALAYLLDPSFQTLNENGRPLVGGHIEVYYHNTSVKYVTKADFEGTNNPFKVPLNSKGMAVIIADDSNAYDVFCYDAFGALYWSRQNVNTIGGGSGGGGSSVPLVRVAFQNGAWSKLYGDDGFIKANEFGQQALYLPEGGWWHIDATLAVKNNTAQDLLQHISLEWNWNFFIEEDVPWGSYAAAGFPSMMHQIDYTRKATNYRCFGCVVNKDGSHTNDWLSVGLNAYHDTLPDSVEWAVWMDIFKVRDA